jgi:ribose/xylose/arabinose/galactoside ABC-type transport system permease subunit
MLCQLAPGPQLQDLLNYIGCIINRSVVPLIFSLAMLTFIWGVVQYVINGDDESKKEKGRNFMIWGIIGLTVMVCVWGLVKILGNTFGIENAIPQLKQ